MPERKVMFRQNPNIDPPECFGGRNKFEYQMTEWPKLTTPKAWEMQCFCHWSICIFVIVWRKLHFVSYFVVSARLRLTAWKDALRVEFRVFDRKKQGFRSSTIYAVKKMALTQRYLEIILFKAYANLHSEAARTWKKRSAIRWRFQDI